MQRYNIRSRQKAQAFWKIVQGVELEERLKNVELGSAGTHLLFMTSLITLLASGYLWITEGSLIKFWWILLASFITGISAIVSDYYIETILTFLMLSIEESKLDKFAKRIGFSKGRDEDNFKDQESNILIKQEKKDKFPRLSEEMHINEAVESDT